MLFGRGGTIGARYLTDYQPDVHGAGARARGCAVRKMWVTMRMPACDRAAALVGRQHRRDRFHRFSGPLRHRRLASGGDPLSWPLGSACRRTPAQPVACSPCRWYLPHAGPGYRVPSTRESPGRRRGGSAYGRSGQSRPCVDSNGPRAPPASDEDVVHRPVGTMGSHHGRGRTSSLAPGLVPHRSADRYNRGPIAARVA